MSKKTQRGKRTPAPSRKKTSIRRRRTSVPLWRQPVAWGMLLAIAAFIVMVVYGRLPAPSAPPAEKPVNQEARVLEDLRVEVESLLWRIGLQDSDVTQTPSEGMIDLQLRGAYPQPGPIDHFRSRLREISPQLRLDNLAARDELRVFSGPALVARLRFVPDNAPAPTPSTFHGPVAAIIMDDIGRSLATVRQVVAFDQPVTLAILPSTPHAAESAELANAAGREVMVHIPMEPQGYPAIEPGKDALLLEHSAWEVQRRLADMFARVPHAIGGNNHMGSRYTEYAQGMEVVAGFMKERGLFFVDSRTTGKTIAEQVMRDHQVPVVARDVFLDNEQDVVKIRAQIQHLVAQARSHGVALGICHPYRETVEALGQELPRLQQEGVRLITVTELLGQRQARGN